MRLLVSSRIRTLLALPFLVALLALPAYAEPDPSTAPATQSAAPADSTPSVPNVPDSAETEQKSEDSAPESATGETKPEDGVDSAASDPASGEAKPEESDAAKTEESENADTAAAEQPKSSILINIDKSIQELTVFVDGVELYTWLVSTGTRGYSTPSGTYTASSMNEIWYSRQWDNAPMPHAIFFTKKGHAIHGTLEEKKLGQAASHGCVRLSRENAKTLFQLVKATGLENTRVVLTGVTKGGEGPKVASHGRRQEAFPPWFVPGPGMFVEPAPNRKKRRGLFGRRWFDGPQGYYAPPRYYRRGY
jgi:lipoprotein-anchoring transpeptidase ErfK/SrfK